MGAKETAKPKRSFAGIVPPPPPEIASVGAVPQAYQGGGAMPPLQTQSPIQMLPQSTLAQGGMPQIGGVSQDDSPMQQEQPQQSAEPDPLRQAFIDHLNRPVDDPMTHPEYKNLVEQMSRDNNEERGQQKALSFFGDIIAPAMAAFGGPAAGAAGVQLMQKAQADAQALRQQRRQSQNEGLQALKFFKNLHDTGGKEALLQSGLMLKLMHEDNSVVTNQGKLGEQTRHHQATEGVQKTKAETQAAETASKSKYRDALGGESLARTGEIAKNAEAKRALEGSQVEKNKKLTGWIDSVNQSKIDLQKAQTSALGANAAANTSRAASMAKRTGDMHEVSTAQINYLNGAKTEAEKATRLEHIAGAQKALAAALKDEEPTEENLPTDEDTPIEIYPPEWQTAIIKQRAQAQLKGMKK